MIESISIKNIATFDDFGVQINNLKRINFIYGANGTGKTTISNFLHDSTDAKFSNCSLAWKDGQESKILVYNKAFRENNFGQGKLNGIFTLGDATIEEIQVIEEKTTALNLIKTNGIQLRQALELQTLRQEKLESEFKEFAWAKIYKRYEHLLKYTIIGAKSKEKFKNELLQKTSNNSTQASSLEDILFKVNALFSEELQSEAPISNIDFSRIVSIENNPIWKKIVIGKGDIDIANLIQNLNINDWVYQGRNYLTENDICPFCQQHTITSDFRTQLESYFDASFLDDIKLIKDLLIEYKFLTDNLINQLNIIEKHQKYIINSKLNIDQYSTVLKSLIIHNTTNIELINNKVKEPSRSFKMVSLKYSLETISELIQNANTEIANHNKIVANYNEERILLIRSIWKFIAEEFKTDIVKFKNQNNILLSEINDLQNRIKSKQAEYRFLDAEIKRLSKNVTSIQPTINEINRVLESHGFTNFYIVSAKDAGFYQIQRDDGTIADSTLSEGEITLLTFLYYLQLAKGGITEKTINEERILVIDDPVSNLDSNVLLLVSNLIKELIKNVKSGLGTIKQIIILTHNIYFHKQVSFIKSINQICENTNYWILKKNNSLSEIQSCGTKNPIQS